MNDSLAQTLKINFITLIKKAWLQRHSNLVLTQAELLIKIFSKPCMVILKKKLNKTLLKLFGHQNLIDVKFK